jgi:hypothetical protein
MSKGSKQRPTDLKAYSANYDAIFRKDKTMQIKVQENADDIGKCGCGRSPTGKCIGWHGLTEDEYADRKEKYETGKVDLSGKDI